ncbi:hypothetical protein P43SY_004621 [Pythium insidiosum]|uniref:Thioredoxin domain-containing protein n=1 Tax=Pythium insidiosum TaxID=114742 RepID=A0AAD5LB88_PYTIN|nr:hypothetical protein P43SY_004621 [Pythium insidiosum]
MQRPPLRTRRAALGIGAPVLAIFALASVAFVMTVHNLSQSAGAIARANDVGSVASPEGQLRAAERRVEQAPLVNGPVAARVEPPSQAPVTTIPRATNHRIQTPPPTQESTKAAVVQVEDVPMPTPAASTKAPLQPDPVMPPTAAAETTTAPSSPKPLASVRPLEERHDVVYGFDDMNAYLDKYSPRHEGETLFLYFTCSDDAFRPLNWSDTCRDAMEHVYDVFSKSPSTNRLVTIYAGSEKFWQYKNAFYDDRDLRVKTVPCLMKWHNRRGETSGMMISETLLDDPLLRYLFKNTDRPDEHLHAGAFVGTKRIDTVDSYDAYNAALTAYQAQPEPHHPLFLLFVSGRLAENNRPWCPYCRFSEIPMEYGFYAFAPPGARLLRIEVTKTYQEWKTPNPFREDPSLGPLRGVPAFFIVRRRDRETGEWTLERVNERFDRIETVRALYHRSRLP